VIPYLIVVINLCTSTILDKNVSCRPPSARLSATFKTSIAIVYSGRFFERLTSLLAISRLRTPSIKFERLLFSSFATAANLALNAFSILSDIVVSFIAAQIVQL
jgi:hypothetical protein